MALQAIKQGDELVLSPCAAIEEKLKELQEGNSRRITPKQAVNIVVQGDPELTESLTGVTTMRITRHATALVLSICKRGDDQVYPAPRLPGQAISEDEIADWLKEGNEDANYTAPPIDVSGETVLSDDGLEVEKPEGHVADLVDHSGSTGESDSTNAAAKLIEELKKQDPIPLPKQPGKSVDAADGADGAIKRRFGSQ